MMTVTLRRGFKSEANSIAREIRGELHLKPADPLDPWALAEHLTIPILPLSDLREDSPAMVRHFSRRDQAAFSAVTVFEGSSRLIVHNDSHSRGRQASNVAHELSHGLLLHPPVVPIDGRGCRDWHQGLELEANWLAGALLISDEAALLIARRRLTIAQAAEVYGVSEAMARFRLNVTAAVVRVRRRQRYGYG